MADEKNQEETDKERGEGELSPDEAQGDPDQLDEAEGAVPEEIHPEDDGISEAEDQPEAEDRPEAEDGVHGIDHETEVAEPAMGEVPAEHAAAPEEPPGVTKHWYIIHAYSGFEQKVAESLKTRSEAFGFAERLGQILIPTEEVVELKNGKKVTSKRLLYPGYVLVQMEMDDELWHAVKSTPRVTGFVGGGTKPVPLTADEVNSVLYRQASTAERPRPKLTFEKHETVKIIDGPFTNFSGKVDEVNSDRSTLRVMVTIFGRSTPVELDFLQVEKI
jgi:transcriptional antiterminator NusG